VSEIEKKSYDSVAKTLHWLIALIAILMLIAGWGLEDLSLEEKTQVIMIHSGLGTTVFVLMLLRLIWRLTHQPPTPLLVPDWQQKVSTVVHGSFYVLLMMQPIFGVLQAAYIDYPVLAFGVIEYSALAVDSEDTYLLFHRLHGLTAFTLILLILVHAGAALGRHFYLKDNVMKRMLPFAKVE
jgi:cytochrome b561